MMAVPYLGNVSPELKIKALKCFADYKADKELLKNNIIENYTWYRRQHGAMVDAKRNMPKPTTAYIFNAIENKYADALDNYPEVSVIEREESDTQTAGILSKILPAQLEMSGFKKAYKENWRRKLKGGTGIYFVSYDYSTDQIIINSVNVLSFFADFNVEDIQNSSFIFVTRCEDNETLRTKYPEHAAVFTGDCTVETVDGTKPARDRTEVVDCYYKKLYTDQNGRTKTAVHMMKLVGENIIAATEDLPEYERGLYNHGKYPFITDRMYPTEDCPYGFGIVDVVKNPQEYIDKLDESIARNTLISSRSRYYVKDNGGVNLDLLADCNVDVIPVQGNPDEIIKEFQPRMLSGYVTQYRDRKIEELKEIIGNRDFQQGGNAGGVTSGSAIELLQRSGEKMSRASVDDAYDAYREVCIMVIEVMRQFFTKERVYRISGDDGSTDFVNFSGANLTKPDAFGLGTDDPVTFDISVTAQRSNPYTKQGNNATMSELWGMGVFKPENIESSILLIKNMQFDGKEKLMQDMQNKIQQIKMQQLAEQQSQMPPEAQIPQEAQMPPEGMVAVPIG